MASTPEQVGAAIQQHFAKAERADIVTKAQLVAQHNATNHPLLFDKDRDINNVISLPALVSLCVQAPISQSTKSRQHAL